MGHPLYFVCLVDLGPMNKSGLPHFGGGIGGRAGFFFAFALL
jgi:hypothetical protein